MAPKMFRALISGHLRVLLPVDAVGIRGIPFQQPPMAHRFPVDYAHNRVGGNPGLVRKKGDAHQDADHFRPIQWMNSPE